MCKSKHLYVRRYVSGCFALNLPLKLIATFNVSLELQGGECSDQLTLICRHSETGMAPLWIHNGTVESGQLLATAFPGTVYTVLTRTEHTATITGVDNVRALDGYVFQCAYEDLGNLTKSNAVKYSFIPPGQSYGCCMCTAYSTCVTCSTLIVEIIIQKQIITIRHYIIC